MYTVSFNLIKVLRLLMSLLHFKTKKNQELAPYPTSLFKYFQLAPLSCVWGSVYTYVYLYLRLKLKSY